MTVPPRILKIDEVVARTALSKSTIERAIKAGVFPKSLKLSTRAVGWLESDIHEWIEDRINNVKRKYN